MSPADVPEPVVRRDYQQQPRLPQPRHLRRRLALRGSRRCQGDAGKKAGARARRGARRARQGALARGRSSSSAATRNAYRGVVSARDGWVERPFSEAAFSSSKPGDTTGLVETSYGFHVLYLVRFIPPVHVTIAEAAPKIRDACSPNSKARLRQARRRRDGAPQDRATPGAFAEVSAFGAILEEMVRRVPGAVGAVFADWEGEPVDQFAHIPPLDIQLVGRALGRGLVAGDAAARRARARRRRGAAHRGRARHRAGAPRDRPLLRGARHQARRAPGDGAARARARRRTSCEARCERRAVSRRSLGSLLVCARAFGRPGGDYRARLARVERPRAAGRRGDRRRLPDHARPSTLDWSALGARDVVWFVYPRTAVDGGMLRRWLEAGGRARHRRRLRRLRRGARGARDPAPRGELADGRSLRRQPALPIARQTLSTELAASASPSSSPTIRRSSRRRRRRPSRFRRAPRSSSRGASAKALRRARRSQRAHQQHARASTRNLRVRPRAGHSTCKPGRAHPPRHAELRGARRAARAISPSRSGERWFAALEQVHRVRSTTGRTPPSPVARSACSRRSWPPSRSCSSPRCLAGAAASSTATGRAPRTASRMARLEPPTLPRDYLPRRGGAAPVGGARRRR